MALTPAAEPFAYSGAGKLPKAATSVGHVSKVQVALRCPRGRRTSATSWSDRLPASGASGAWITEVRSVARLWSSHPARPRLKARRASRHQPVAASRRRRRHFPTVQVTRVISPEMAGAQRPTTSTTRRSAGGVRDVGRGAQRVVGLVLLADEVGFLLAPSRHTASVNERARRALRAEGGQVETTRSPRSFPRHRGRPRGARRPGVQSRSRVGRAPHYRRGRRGPPRRSGVRCRRCRPLATRARSRTSGSVPRRRDPPSRHARP